MQPTASPPLMIAQHTPGPWTVRGEYAVDQSGVIVASAQYNPGRDPRFPSVDGLGPGRPKEERAANARLIAAAPDLLAALRELVHQVEIAGAVDDNGHRLTNLQALHAGRAAIAAAEGRP